MALDMLIKVAGLSAYAVPAIIAMLLGLRSWPLSQLARRQRLNRDKSVAC